SSYIHATKEINDTGQVTESVNINDDAIPQSDVELLRQQDRTGVGVVVEDRIIGGSHSRCDSDVGPLGARNPNEPSMATVFRMAAAHEEEPERQAPVHGEQGR